MFGGILPSLEVTCSSAQDMTFQHCGSCKKPQGIIQNTKRRPRKYCCEKVWSEADLTAMNPVSWDQFRAGRVWRELLVETLAPPCTTADCSVQLLTRQGSASCVQLDGFTAQRAASLYLSECGTNPSY